MYLWFIYLLIVFIYCLLIFLAAMGWLGVNPETHQTGKNKPVFISMIVPFRNEENQLPELLDCMKAIKYPKNLFEIIFVNDHSSDNSQSIVNSVLPVLSNCELIINSSDIEGKKASIKHGIEFAKGELLILTDADCSFSPSRLTDFANFFVQNKKPDMIIGLVDYKDEPFFLSKIMRLEFLSLILSGAGFAGRGTPMYCNGANLGVKKTVFDEELDLKYELASGDDVFLLHELKKQKNRIKLLKSRGSLVFTAPPEGLKDFFFQRKRWGAKSLSYTDRETIILTLFVFLTNFLIPIVFVLSVVTNEYMLFLLGIAAKLSIDLLLFIVGIRFFKIGIEVLIVPFLELIYPFYIFITGISGIIKKPFHWKGRKYN